MRVALISLEPWDEVWRRNQHFATELVAQGLASNVLFVEPPLLSSRPGSAREVAPGITALRLSLRLPKRAGGLAVAGAMLRRLTSDADVLWVNDAVLGVHCLARGQHTIYDVTDDWREFDFPPRIRRRLVRAENLLAIKARTVVCSAVLARRWRDRYGVEAHVVHNGVDVAAWQEATPRSLAGPGPHIGYVGTLHEERLDIDLVVSLADAGLGQVHLVGPDFLGDEARDRLTRHPKIAMQGPVPFQAVASWTKAMDVLICPHVVTPFTLSLDAIKSYEYLASGRPVVATRTSGFQHLTSPSLAAVDAVGFAEEVRRALRSPPIDPPVVGALSWTHRAHEFARVLASPRIDVQAETAATSPAHESAC